MFHVFLLEETDETVIVYLIEAIGEQCKDVDQNVSVIPAWCMIHLL